MKRLHKISLLVALAGLSTPVFAQDSAPGASGPDTAGEAQTQRGPETTTPAAPSATTPSQIVDQEFPSYDLDKNGQLSAAEFSSWVVKLRKPAADGAAPSDSQSWSASLFARADTDHNQSVSKAEMTTLLTAAKG